MKSARRQFFVSTLAIVLGLQAAPGFSQTALGGSSQTYPSKPVRIIVGVPAGTGPDLGARNFAAQLSVELGQPVIVENRPGNAGLIGMDAVAKSVPDGYTLGAGQIANLAANPRLYDHPPFDVERDLVPISLLGKHRWLLYVHPLVPAKSLAEFVALAKAKPGAISYAVTGVGNFQHLSGEWFAKLTGTQLRPIPYGASGWISDLLSGRVDATFWPLITMVDHVKNGNLRALAISGQERSPLLPEVPTFGEVGLPEFEPYVWFGIVAPAGLPGPITEKLAAASARAAQSQPFRDFLASVGAAAVGSTPAEFGVFLKSERAHWKQVITDAKIKLE